MMNWWKKTESVGGLFVETLGDIIQPEVMAIIQFEDHGKSSVIAVLFGFHGLSEIQIKSTVF